MKLLFRIVCCLALSVAVANPVAAQSRKKTLADIRQELSVLYVDIQRLKTQLSTTGTASGISDVGDSSLERIDALEGEMRRLTGQVEELQFKVERIVKDGTNRIGDLEFRLVELEGGDTSKLKETTTLGGKDILTPSAPVIVLPQAASNAEMAVNEQSDFDAAKAAYDAGDFTGAATKFKTYLDDYPGGVLTSNANYWRGEALANTENWSQAARSFLQAFSSAPDGKLAPISLFRLGVSLDKIGQQSEACLTLDEVTKRYPGSDADSRARREIATLQCSN